MLLSETTTIGPRSGRDLDTPFEIMPQLKEAGH
jgi:hypothetical protein